MIIAVTNQKGGSGKTSLTGNLAAVLARRRSVLAVDADRQGSLHAWLGGYEGLEVAHIPSPVPLERALSGERARHGLVLVDLPSHDPQPTAIALERAALALVPVVPSPLDIMAAAPLLQGLAEGRTPGLVVLSMVRAGTRAADEARAALKTFGVPLARVPLGHRTAYVQAVAAGLPVVAYAGRSLAAMEIEALGREVLRILRR